MTLEDTSKSFALSVGRTTKVHCPCRIAGTIGVLPTGVAVRVVRMRSVTQLLDTYFIYGDSWSMKRAVALRGE